MEQLQLLASTLGLSVLAGIRLYATVLGMGLIVRFGWLQLPPALESLNVLADTRVLVASGLFVIIEFLADKVPWIDSAWDSFHTFIRPIGAVLLTGVLGSQLDPAWQMLLMILGGTVALSSHGAKSATRLAVNHSPEPVSNIALSLAEDAILPLGIWLTVNHPLIMGSIVLVFLALLIWLGPKVWRMFRVEVAALTSLVKSWFRESDGPAPALVTGPVSGFFRQHRHLWEELPASCRAHLERQDVTPVGPAIRVVGSKSVKAPGSIGYLVDSGSDLVFVSKRTWGHKVVRIPVTQIRDVRIRKHLILDSVVVDAGQQYRFDLFKAAARPVGESSTAMAPA